MQGYYISLIAKFVIKSNYTIWSAADKIIGIFENLTEAFKAGVSTFLINVMFRFWSIILLRLNLSSKLRYYFGTYK